MLDVFLLSVYDLLLNRVQLSVQVLDRQGRFFFEVLFDEVGVDVARAREDLVLLLSHVYLQARLRRVG